jgi:hypothetical protein
MEGQGLEPLDFKVLAEAEAVRLTAPTEQALAQMVVAEVVGTSLVGPLEAVVVQTLAEAEAEASTIKLVVLEALELQ